MGHTIAGTRRARLAEAATRARRPDKRKMEALRHRTPFWWVAVFLFLFAAYQISMNPFGFSSLTQRYTQDISNLLITGPYFYPATGHDALSVALVEDTTLSDLHMPWPWSYGAQARALDALLAYRPKAVIVDMLFVDPRNDNTLDELTDEIGRYKRADVPLYFAGATDLDDGTPVIRPELRNAGARVLDPSILVNQGIVRQYPIAGRCMNGERDGRRCRSMALSVYRDLYPAQPLDVNPAGLMEIVWGTKPDPTNAKWMRFTDENGIPRSCSDRPGFLRRAMRAFFDPAKVRSRCPYESVIPVEKLLQGTDDPDIAKLAQNRIVFYGASLEGVQDKSFTPVNGLIGSVFVHAMALDNLITFDGKPEQNVVSIAGVTLDNDPIQILAIVPVILILAWIHIRNLRTRRHKREERAHENAEAFEYLLDKAMEFLWHGGAWMLALTAGLALTLAVGLSVANWAEVVFVSVELAAMLLVGVPDAIWGYLHHVAGGTVQPEHA